MLVLWNVFLGALILCMTKGNLYEDHVDHGIRRMNEIRSWHDSPPIKRHPDPKWDHDTERYAAKLAAESKFLHSSGMEIDGVGWMENLFGGGYSTNKTRNTIRGIEAWYAEIRRYDYEAPHFAAGHFTCSIWKETIYHSYGVAANKTTGRVIVVGAVSPYCNFPDTDSMRDNVRPPKNELACRKSAKVTCDIPLYSACREPYNDMIRCILPRR